MRGVYEGPLWKQRDRRAVCLPKRKVYRGQNPFNKRDLHADWEPAPRVVSPSFAATCDECGAETTVPFQPDPGRKVYCRGCHAKRKARRRA